ncbi:hypothetical protein [Bdellovibrio bacteriovorus]|uniref:hypothetical protein n=1 Tax=Bdellovibrio bacteriovorus TaxID=959 RepID=UPI0035A81CDC
MPISSLLINFLLLMVIAFGLRKIQAIQSTVSLILRGALFIGAVWLAITAIGYLFTPLFFDHAESNIATVAATWLKGNLIYTPVESANRYSLLYGPWPYLVTAFFQSFGSSTVFLSKIPGVLNLGLLFAGFTLLGSELKASRSEKFFALALVALVLLGFYNFSYWNRPDSYLMAYVFLALVLVTKSSKVGPWGTYLGVALLAGLASNCKLHGVLYFAPIIVHFLEVQKNQRSVVKLSVAGALFLVGAILPFLFSHVGGEFYLSWLKMASKHGLVLKDFIKNVTFITSFTLLLILFGFPRKYKITFIAFCVSVLLVAVAASKPGAGPHHFIPFIPVILWWSLREYFEMSQEDRNKVSIVWVAFVLTVTLNAVNRQKRVVELFSQTSERKAEFIDLQNLVGELPPGDVEMGIAGNLAYESTFYKVSLVAQNRGLLLDGAALMDTSASKLEIPERTIAVIKACAIPYFIFPKKESPWSIINFYDDKPLFSDEFKKNFNTSYEKDRESNYFAVYKCKSAR